MTSIPREGGSVAEVRWASRSQLGAPLGAVNEGRGGAIEAIGGTWVTEEMRCTPLGVLVSPDVEACGVGLTVLERPAKSSRALPSASGS